VNPQPWLATDLWDDLLRKVTQGLTGEAVASLQGPPIRGGESGFSTRAPYAGMTGIPEHGETAGMGTEYVFGSGDVASSPSAKAAIKYTLATNPESLGLTPETLRSIAAGAPDAMWTPHAGTGEMRPAVYGGLTAAQIRALMALEEDTYGPDVPGVASRALQDREKALHDMQFASE
ncbi:MAG: hypothetical protein ACRDHF_13805, partial [Tepidiformaceae bacterium]